MSQYASVREKLLRAGAHTVRCALCTALSRTWRSPSRVGDISLTNYAECQSCHPCHPKKEGSIASNHSAAHVRHSSPRSYLSVVCVLALLHFPPLRVNTSLANTPFPRSALGDNCSFGHGCLLRFAEFDQRRRMGSSRAHLICASTRCTRPPVPICSRCQLPRKTTFGVACDPGLLFFWSATSWF